MDEGEEWLAEARKRLAKFRFRRFTERQILDEARQVRAGTLDGTDSDVYVVWTDMAWHWFFNDDEKYLRNGFVGFLQRTPEEIGADFVLEGRLLQE